MRIELKTLLNSLIANERARRDKSLSIRLSQLAEGIPAGHSARAVQFGAACAKELHARAARWLMHTRRVFAETRTPWSLANAAAVETVLTEELVSDTRRLEALYKGKFPGQPSTPSPPALGEAYEAATGRLGLEIKLRVLAEEAVRIPLAEHLAATRYSDVAAAWGRANQLFRSPQPNHKAVVTEAIGAVEQLGRLLIHQPTATLGDVIRELRKSERIGAPLLKGVEELWGWSSGEPGVRHGARADDPVDSAVAQYVLTLAEAALMLLIVRDTG